VGVDRDLLVARRHAALHLRRRRAQQGDQNLVCSRAWQPKGDFVQGQGTQKDAGTRAKEVIAVRLTKWLNYGNSTEGGHADGYQCVDGCRRDRPDFDTDVRRTAFLVVDRPKVLETPPERLIR
jgi:hypothetical protein